MVTLVRFEDLSKSCLTACIFLSLKFRFDFTARLHKRITEPARVIPILDNQVMHGAPGAVGKASLPPYSGKINGGKLAMLDNEYTHIVHPLLSAAVQRTSLHIASCLRS